jgi:hypothetical protein
VTFFSRPLKINSSWLGSYEKAKDGAPFIIRTSIRSRFLSINRSYPENETAADKNSDQKVKNKGISCLTLSY